MSFLKSEYERLKEEGYTEEQIEALLPHSQVKLNVFDSPMSANRVDKGVKIVEGNLSKRTSNIMMGYNRSGLTLENGDYISLNEVQQAINTALSTNGENKKIACVRTGRVLTPKEVLDDITNTVKQASTIRLEGRSEKITNQDSQKVSIKGNQKDEYVRKGLAMLGNSGIKLPSGEYVQAVEIQKALKDYVFLKGPEPIPNVKKKVVQRSKTTWKSWPILLTAVLLIISMIGITPTKTVVDKVINQVSSLEFQMDSYSTVEIYENADEIAHRVQSEFEIGKSTSVNEGVRYHESSDFDFGGSSKYGTFGEGLRDAGNYTADLFSIISNGRIVKVSSSAGTNLGDVVASTAKELGVETSSLVVRVHLGGPVSGWVDVTDLIDVADLTPQVVAEKSVLDEQIKGVQDNFTGTITFQTKTGPVTAKVLDENGNLLKSGSTVIGSDGNSYKISSISLGQYENVEEIETVTPRKVTFGIENLTAVEAFASVAAGILAGVIFKKKETEEKTVTEEEYQEMLSQAKKKFDSNSKFVRLINKLRGKKPNWERINFYIKKGNLEVDHISELYDKEEEGPKL